MNILNVLGLIFIFFNKNLFIVGISKISKSTISIIYILFIFWAALSFFYSINPTEMLVNISRQLAVFFMYVNIGVFIYQLKYKSNVFSWIIIAILSIEVYYVISDAVQMMNEIGRIDPGSLKGVTANRNITAFSLAIKIPFIYYLIFSLNKFKFNFSLSVLLFFTISGLLMIQSRASYIALLITLISFTGVIIYCSNQINKKIIIKLLYVFFPLIFSIFTNQLIIKNKGADAISRALTIGNINTDDSITARLRYYGDVWEHFTENPILGVGLGNWKLKSIEYDRLNMKGYIVPYHAHSDFIQLFAELGILGGLLYLSIFILCVFFTVKCFIVYKKKDLNRSIFLIFLLTSIAVYSIDASLNFPIARPQVLVCWALIVSLINYNYHIKFNFKTIRNKYINILIIISILILLPSIYISNSVYKSLKGQMFFFKILTLIPIEYLLMN